MEPQAATTTLPVAASEPDVDEIRAVHALLRAQQGPFRPKPRLAPLDELIATVLSQATSDRNSEKAFADLRQRFPTWDDVMAAPTPAVADAIRSGGIADQKAAQIKRILQLVNEREGRLDLARLDELTDPEIGEYLTSLPGVGPKTAACVLAFSLLRPAFPVDTHVHRIVIRLGWVPPKTTATRTHELLAPAIPTELRYDLHVALIVHGRTVCRARAPRCRDCVLRQRCPAGAQFETNGL